MSRTRVPGFVVAALAFALLWHLPGAGAAEPGKDSLAGTRLQAMLDGALDTTGIAGSTLDTIVGRQLAMADRGVYPSYRTEEGGTGFPLHAAALNDDVALATRVIDAGTPADARDREGRTPLMVAAAFGNTRIAELLIQRGADPRARDRAYGDTALHFAALVGRIEVAQVLISHGADINLGANLGETPLHYAALYNHRKAIAFLLAEGAKIDAKDGLGLTPLQYASRRARYQSVALLRELGARPDTLRDAVNAGDLMRVRELLRLGADPKQVDMNGTALHLAAAHGHVAIAAALIEAGADIEAEGEPARAHPLHVSALNDRVDMARFLLDRGAEVDARDAEGRTPLIVAAVFGGGKGLGDVLLSHGADPRATDRTWDDPVIHYAAYSGNLAFIELLVSRGVEVNTRNRISCAAALHYAAACAQSDVIAYLAGHGYERAFARRNMEVIALLKELGAAK